MDSIKKLRFSFTTKNERKTDVRTPDGRRGVKLRLCGTLVNVMTEKNIRRRNKSNVVLFVGNLICWSKQQLFVFASLFTKQKRIQPTKHIRVRSDAVFVFFAVFYADFVL